MAIRMQTSNTCRGGLAVGKGSPTSLKTMSLIYFLRSILSYYEDYLQAWKSSRLSRLQHWEMK